MPLLAIAMLFDIPAIGVELSNDFGMSGSKSKSFNPFSDRFFFYQAIRTTNLPTDKVSGNDNTDTSAGPIQYLTDANQVITVSAATPLVIDNFITNSGDAWSQYLPNPTAPASLTTGAIPTGEHTLWIRGTGSVALSANTATITGAGSATEGNPLTIDVTVGGTVDLVKTGDVDVFQLHTGGYSIEPLFLDSVGSVASRAGTQSLENLSTDYPRVLDALDGKADGVELVDKVPASTLVQSTYDSDTGVANILSLDGSNSYIIWANKLTIGERYEVKYTEIAKTGAGIKIEDQGPLKVFDSGSEKYRFTCATSNFSVVRYGITDTTFKISVKKVSSAAARIASKFKSGVSASDLADGNYNVYSLNGNVIDFMYWSKSGATRLLNMFDGTNTASVAFDFSANLEYDIGGIWGYYIASSANKMQVSASSSDSSLSDFAGRFPITGDSMVFGESNNMLLYLKDIKILPPPSGWRAE